MCGRFALATEKHILEMLLELELRSEFNPRFNIAPTQELLALRLKPNEGCRELCMLKWGLIPPWSKDASPGYKLINARSEAAAEKPAFKDAFARRRALIPASGFYEWKKEAEGKQPYYIGMKNEEPFFLAGLWERWRGEDAVVESCTILTTAANSIVSPLHHRMPVIITGELSAEWLDCGTDPVELHKMLVPFPEEDNMFAYPVGRLVNSPANGHPDCITQVHFG